MYIESVQLKNFRNYDSLELTFDKGTNIFMGIMHREKLIFWNPSIYAEQPKSSQRKQGQRKSLSSEKKKHISG